MENLTEVTSFHGTNKQNASKIAKQGVRISIPRFDDQRVKNPGSLGYGFYTFMDDFPEARELAFEFSNKFTSEVVVIRVMSQVDMSSILDMNNANDRMQYLHYFRRAHKKIMGICKQRGLSLSNRKQHVFDGLMIESYIRYLKTRQKTIVNGVIHDTVTYVGTDGMSDMENGREFCIRNTGMIISTSEC
ncbi:MULTISPECIES: hypothetical protein [Levilactobacillus]|uniref:hypothetical protein n=1 Tax=Levilactobacillus TaxID=2767886 RepID=UPI0019505155|nr:hypothetical protein [Levilactobacillus sp. 244-2]